MTEKVRLCCPDCHRTMLAEREMTDPPLTAAVEVLCDKCDDGGGFPEVHYYDAEGRWFDGERFRRIDGDTEDLNGIRTIDRAAEQPARP
jgi:hypothetical protein